MRVMVIVKATKDLPATQGGPATRLSLTPDGKSIAFSTSKSSSNLWLIELNGVTPP